MKLSKMSMKNVRIKNLNEQFPAQDILVQSGQLVQYGSGIYAYNNIPLGVKQNLERIIRNTLDENGCIEVSLPTLQPTSLWEESGRLDKYVEEGTMLTIKKGAGNFCLAPTAEEAMVDFVRDKVKSYKNLPATFYQIGEKYRNELRARGYLLRGKTFPMMDAYSFNKDEEDLVDSYNTLRNAYLELFEKLGLDVVPVAADNGTIGGKKSEEFMMISDIGEDNVLFDEETGVAFNSEILQREDYKEYLETEYGITDISRLVPKKTIELGHIFQLGTKYSESMKNATYIDKDAIEKPYHMGCYGIGVSRTLATIYEKSLIRDEKDNPIGIALPTNIAPYLIQIIPKIENPVKKAEAIALYETLNNHGVQTILDDREDGSMGVKIRDTKVLGTPYMAILGDKTRKGEVELEETKTGKKVIVKQLELAEALIKFNKERIGNPDSSLGNFIDFNEKEIKDSNSLEIE